jgi:hydroxysqualene dehydroxylase
VSAVDVVVVGGGCAGLSAACALAEAGARVTVVEARPVLGGRTFATRDRRSGDWVDNGQHVLFGCYHETLAYLDRIGTRRQLRVQGSLAVPMVDRGGRTSELRCPALPSPLQLAAGVLAWDALPFQDRASIAGLSRALAPAAVPPPPDETVSAWLRRHGQTDRLCEMLWEPLALAALNQPIDVATATTFVEVIRRMLGPGPDDAAIAWATDSLSAVLVEPAAAFIERHGGEVLRGASAVVTATGSPAPAVRVDGRVLEARAVIAAVPWHAIEGLFDPLPDSVREVATHAATRRSAPIVTVNLWLDRRVLDAPFVGLPGRTFQWVFDKSRLTPGASHLSLVCSGAESVVALANEAIVALALGELSQALPAARAARVQHATAVRERKATFSLAAGEPPRPSTLTGLHGFFLAGDWTDTGLPATIESAVISGHRAAAAAMQYLRHRDRVTA